MATPVESKSDAAAGGGPNPTHPAPHPVLAFIAEWGAVMAVPAVLIAVICPALGASVATTAIVTVAVCAALGGAIVFVQIRRALERHKVTLNRVLRVLPWLGILTLVGANIYIHYRPPNDRWQNWEHEIFAALDQCRDVSETADTCMAHALAIRQHPAMEGSGSEPQADLAFDLRAGSVLLRHPQLREKLGVWVGIGNKFLGTGFSQPHGNRDYAAARIPEVLIPNFRDTNEAVWTWMLEPVATSLSRIVADVVYNSEPMQAMAAGRDRREFAPFREEIRTRIAMFNDTMPPVIRFAQITKTQYSGCLGRRDRLRVFASRLGPVVNMKLADAAQFSGYVLKPEEAKSDTKLYLMVFVPSHPDQIVSATWREILPKLEGWSREPKTCS